MRATCAIAVAVLLTASGCLRRTPPGFDVSRISDLSCRQLLPPADQPPAWITPADLNGRFRLSRWCETVGPVYFKPRPDAVFDKPIDRLAIISWNIHEGGGDVDELVRRLRRGEFTAGEPIDQFVLLLQEVTRRDSAVPRRIPRGYPAPRRIGSRSGSRAGDVPHFADDRFAVLYAPSMRNGKHDEESEDAEDRGNAIVSTLPLQEARLIELPLERQRRVAAAAIVAGHNGSGTQWRLDLVNVHLDTALALFHGGPFAARRRQVGALLESLRSSMDPSQGNTATVVAGDFNTWLGDREGAVHILRAAFPDTPAADRAPTWAGPLGLHATLDHIFIRGRVSPTAVTRLSSRFGSDHYPLLTVVRF